MRLRASLWGSFVLAPIVPPRPNLGPEPLVETVSVVGPVLAACAGVAIAALATWRLLQLRRRPRLRAIVAVHHRDVLEPVPPAPRPAVVEWAELVRNALVARFGSPWVAKTTEEIATSSEIAGWLDQDQREQLVQFLHEADRIKFASEPAMSDYDERWGAWVTAFIAAAVPAAGATSRIKGR